MEKMEYVLIALSVLLFAVSAVSAWTIPNLYIESLSFEEYIVTVTNGSNTTNQTWVRVVTVVRNALDSGVAAASTTRTDNLLGAVDHATPILGSGERYTITQAYQCISAHTHVALADYYNVVSEWNEGDNAASVYIDCLV